jgi:hypothetical protein
MTVLVIEFFHLFQKFLQISHNCEISEKIALQNTLIMMPEGDPSTFLPVKNSKGACP